MLQQASSLHGAQQLVELGKRCHLQVGGKLLNSRFKMVAGRLKDAFAILSGVVTITQGWQEPDLSAAVAADMHMVVAEVQTQGSEGHLQLKVGNWRGSTPLFYCGAPPASLPAGASNLPFLSPRTLQALLDQQTAEDRSWISRTSTRHWARSASSCAPSCLGWAWACTT